MDRRVNVRGVLDEWRFCFVSCNFES